MTYRISCTLFEPDPALGLSLMRKYQGIGMTAQPETRSSNTSSVIIAASVSLLALPSAVLAFTADFSVHESAASSVESVPVTGQDTAFSSALTLQSLAKGRLFPFTPASVSAKPERLVTVAIRVDPAEARAITVRGRNSARKDTDSAQLGIASTGFSLGISRGYRNFAETVSTPRPAADLTDIRKFRMAPSAKADNSRFSPHISMDDNHLPGRAPRTFAGDGSEVDLGGAYRVTKNLNVTAGVRYSQERERLTPLTDGKQDSQAVYVGTQFSF